MSIPLTGGSAGIGFTYDALGRTAGRTIDSGNSVGPIVYDALGRVTSVPVTPLSSTAFGYNYVGSTPRLDNITLPNGQTDKYAYTTDGNYRLAKLQHFKGTFTNLISEFDYTGYDNAGNITGWSQQVGTSAAQTWANGYDAADELTSAVRSGTGPISESYSYDAAGNRLQEQTLSNLTLGTFNNVNQLTALSTTSAMTFSGSVNKPGTLTVNGNAVSLDGNNNFTASLLLSSGTQTVPVVAQDASGNKRTNKYQVNVTPTNVSPTYDFDGNMLTDENGNTFTWDAENELVKIVNGSNTYQFAYDGLGHRISETDNNTLVKQWVWAGNTLSEERNASNVVTKRFFAQGFQIINGSTITNYFYTRDHLGSIREVIDNNGNIVARYDYDVYGRVTPVGTISVTSDFQYAGMYAHAATSLNFTLYRAYDPNMGRWLSRDPIAENGGLNLYGYVGNDPSRYTDPNGKFAWIPVIITIWAAHEIIDTTEAAILGVISANSLQNQISIYQQAVKDANCHYNGEIPPEVQEQFDKWKSDIINNSGGNIKDIIEAVPGTSMTGPPTDPPEQFHEK